MHRFHVTTTNEDGVVSVAVEGELDIATAPALDAVVAEAFAEGDEPVRLDLAGVPFMDSTGLRCLLSARRRAQGAGRALSLRNIQPRVLRVFEMTGSGALFDLG